MFFNDLLQRRLASLLHPWLQQEPELQLKLGFLRSHCIAKNLNFDTSILNQLLDEPTRLSFKEVRVEQLNLRISYWSVPTFTIEVHGVHVTLSVGEVKEEGVLRHRRTPTDTSLEDMKKLLAEIDPEGSALHDVMERISDTSSSRKWTTSLLNVILNHCQLEVNDIHLRVELPISNDSFGYLWEIKELNAKSQYTKHRCFLSALTSSLFVPLKESSFNINARGFRIGLQSKDPIRCVLPSVDLFTCIKLKDLQLIDFNFSILELTLLFAPEDLSIILAFGTLSSSASKCARNGRQLWKIVASRISSLISTPRLVLHKLVDDVGLWLRYVHAYENLLLQVGYPMDNILEISAAMMSWDLKFSQSVKNQWNMISEIEKKLPAEAIAQARRIARHRAGLNAQWAKNHSSESHEILALFSLAWNVICIIFNSITHFFSQKKLSDNPKINGHCRVVSKDSCSQRRFSLSMDKISIIASPINEPPVLGQVVSEIGISYKDLLSFCLSIDALFLSYTENICEQCFSISCGHLKVMSSIIKDVSKNNDNTSYLKGLWDKNVDDAKTILWGEPALMFSPADTRTGLTSETEGASVASLENLLCETWLNWKNSCTKSEGIKSQYLIKPWILCEIKSFVTDQNLKNLNSGFWKFSLIVGKLNFVLGYSPLLSISLLLRQVQHALYRGYSNGRKKVLSPSLVALDDPPLINWDGGYKLNVNEMEMTIVRMLPEKHIQIGVFITGPHIQISLRKEGFYGGNSNLNPIVRQDDLHLTFDIHNIEFSVCPNLKSAFTPRSGYCGLDDVHQLDCLRLMESQIIDIPKSENDICTSRGRISLCTYFKVNGLNAYFGDLENQQCQVIVLNPITIQLSSLREDVHSFSTTVVAFSAALRGMATGLTCLLYMDELFALIKVIVGLFSAISGASTAFDLCGGANFQEFSGQDMVCDDSGSEGTFPSPLTKKKWVSLNCMSTLFVINGAFELKSVDMVLHDSRKSSNMMTSKIILDPVNSKKLAMQSVPEYGILISVQKTCLEFSCKGGNVEVLSDFLGIRSVVFRDQSEIRKSPGQHEIGNLLHSLDCLYEALLPHCSFSLWLGSLQNVSPSGNASNAVDGSTSDGKMSYMVEDFPSAIHTERSRVQSLRFCQKSGFTPNIMAPASSPWLLINIAVSEIYTVGCGVKNILDRAQKSNQLESSLSVGGEFQTIFFQIQGGTIFLETLALAMFVKCFASYCHYIRSLLHVEPASVECIIDETGKDMAIQDGHPSRGTENTFHHEKWKQLEAFTIDLSHFSLVLLAKDESGGLQELLFEVDVHLNYELDNMNRKLSFDLSRFSIISQFLHETIEQRAHDVQIPHFSSIKDSDLSPQFEHSDPGVSLEHTDEIHSVPDDASCSSLPLPEKESLGKNSVLPILHVGRQNYILKQLGVFISVQKPVPRDEIGPLCLNQIWVGGGSISGFDMTISLPEIQIVLSTIETFSEVFGKETSDNVEQKHWSSDQESDRSLEETLPDGAIVAIQDVHQHLYMTVEGVGSKYSLVGAIHYSLVGERALFRVKYQNQRRWKSSVLWFSLISLHAKSDAGEPLRLNYRTGSGFVDISSTNDSGCALWRIISSKPESNEGDIELESYNLVAKNTFYLVNKKNDRGIAIVDGIPEFVSKPGNLFKWKVFHDLPPVQDVVLLDSNSVEASGTNLQHAHVNKERTRGQTGNLPYIVITIDKVTLTILHELSYTKERFPLLKGSISTFEFIVQVLAAKVRVISTTRVVLYYFDAKIFLWREFVHPVEIYIFYRTRLQIQGSETVLHGVPVHFYAGIKELGISVTELSLDVLLFVIGTLNLAGPFAIRSSMILANCCKVENQSDLDLLCHFYDNQDASIARKQSSTIVLRHLGLVNQLPEASYVSIQLSERGVLLTSPIHISFLEAGALTWRTRIMSLQDSKAYPGPYIIVDISRETEDGLSIVVSPLLRIHNETEFSMELRFQRPLQKDAESASVVLKTGDSIDDSIAAFDAINLSGGLKKALMSLNVGNFLFSFRPEITDEFSKSMKLLSVDWSDDLKGGKAVPISGVFDKLSYKVRKAISVHPVRYSFSTTHCSLKYEDGHVANLHFLIQSIRRDVPVIKPDKDGYVRGNRNSPIALQEQKEIHLLPTVRVSNLLQSEIHVLLTDMDPCADNIGNQATIPCGSTVDLYANPVTIYFCVTLTAFSTSCKPVNSGDWVKKLQKQKNDVHLLDIELDFGGGKYFASLRLSRGQKGILEAVIFTSYSLKNETDFPLLCFAPNQKPLSRDEAEKLGYRIPPELGSFLPPKSTNSWFMKYKKVCLKLLEDKASEVLLDLDALSGLTEVGLEVEGSSGFKHIIKLGVSLGPFMSKVNIPSEIISLVPRYILFNESEEVVIVQQCHLEDDLGQMMAINSKQKIALQLRSGISKKRDISVFENLLRKHKNAHDDSLAFIQFRPSEAGLGWSGPVCVASLGRFFLKFKRSMDFTVQQSNEVKADSNHLPEFAAVHVVEEGSTLVLHYYRPPNINLPYRIENCLQEAFILYYQKGLEEPEIVRSGSSVNYVWDDLTLPHKLVVQIKDVHLLREINLDKVRAWKPFYKVGQHRGLGFHLPLDKNPGSSFGESNGMEIVNVGYEVYADGPTRVLRICEFSGSHEGETKFQSSGKIRVRISHFAIHLLEHAKQEIDASEPSVYTPIIIMRLENINLNSIFTDRQKYNQIRVQSLSVDQKWVGAPFAAMLRRHQSDYSDTSDNILHVEILFSSSSNVKQVKYFSVVLQPLDMNLDEETLMRIVPFWRASLSDSNTQSQQYYFDHFEIHPIKIIASFLPGDSYSSYSSMQETLRSLLHSVIKIPAIKNMIVELNGVLVTHALITTCELFIKCAQHYSWYAMRAIYIAKGSPLLPPAFASIFDDSASSSLDVFFDPSSGLINLPGLTIGTFKLIRKCINGKGFSGTKRYFGDMGKTVKTAGSNILFAAVTEISDSVLKGAETSGFNGMVSGFHQGILKLAMEPSVLGTVFMEGGPDRKIKLDRSPGVDELYIEGYLQAMLDTIYKQEYLRVRVIDNQVFLKNLPPNSSLIDEIMDRVKGFLVSKALLKGDSLTASRPLRHVRGESEWKIGPTVLTLCEHLFVSFAIRILRKQAGKFMARVKWRKKMEGDDQKAIVAASATQEQKGKSVWKWGIGKFVLSGVIAYMDGRLCRCIPNPVARRIVSGFLLSFIEKNDNE